ncbi:uncharacterized protein K460DRAFT_198851 [Cucurbitaria berberidis CBS 394.84]|uniref:Uncharacterized protein n=1 Tax=Cucurbitaria berberidis CBS 394.84 TaxID=1168544 RepID=A0A9P4G8S3_9PLEO|nr:uncharacterized protein K460DRAFT_198851 [Cucurbitaria berberidis CBS 394.84]KAF1841126.1 hypothetical protein K460DRAFT_198851 [Cucurbitaria berberidis CBS 394.84]
MAPPTSTPDENAAFLAGCIHKTRSVRDVYESLGLFSQTTDLRKDPDFLKNEANELHFEIKKIAQSFVERNREDPEHLHACLSKDETFSKEICELEGKYGQALWGRADSGHTLPFREQEGPPDELNWDKSKDRECIRFYIHCWIARIAVRDISPTPRKGKGKSKSKVTYLSDGEETDVETPTRSTRSDSSASSEVPYRAPEPPNMYSAPESRGNDAQSADFRAESTDTRIYADDAESIITNSQVATDPPLKRTPPGPSSKRKAPDVQGPYSSSKLPKVSRKARITPALFRERQRDVYSVPRSPTLPLDAAPLTSPNRRPRWKESTQDSDATYMPPPRGFTAETETVVDGDEAVADAMNLVLQPHLLDEEGIQYEFQDQPVAGPSGTYRHPLRQDSVIPDTQNDTVGTVPISTEPHTNLGRNLSKKLLHTMTITQLSTTTPGPQSWQVRKDRSELFRLLLSYLNSINQFSMNSYDVDSEERMDFLLDRLWAYDAEKLRSDLGEDFARLHAALETWMNMRDRLTSFQTTTGYLGQPGEEWKAHLRRMLDLPARAQACIAFGELKGPLNKEGEPHHVAETFDDDLAMIFDLLTRVKGCNGAEEFKAIRLYNEALLKWVRED